jgi:two-component sensor histidine kinase
VSPRQAGNLALVLNELVTNTVKHAAPGQAATHVAVQIGSEGNGTVRLEYRDDGPGYPEDVLHLKRRGVGLYLIQNLVDHALGGWLALANDDGAMTTVRFESEESSTT